nr:hypothetical protein [Tanacetum cinerariifolium]
MNDYKESASIQEDSDSDLQSMPDDDLRSVSEFEAGDSDDIHDNESSLPSMITNALTEQLPGTLSGTLKYCLPLIVKESLQTHDPATSKQFAETQTQLNKKVVKQLNRLFNISYVAQSNRFVTLQRELSKVNKSEVAKKVQVVRLEGVRKELQSQTKHISKYYSSFQDMQS